MTHDVTETLVREWLRTRQGKASCLECIARGLKRNAGEVRVVMSKLLFAQHVYWAERCDCGKRGFKYGR
jgi:hypothetical protein